MSATCSGRAFDRGAADERARAARSSAFRNCSSTSSLVPYAVRTKKRCWASSNSINEPPSVPDSCTACMTIVESTMSRSRLELTASPTWPSASNCSTLRASSALRASRARTRSRLRTAMAAAAANAVRSAIGPILERIDLGAPHRQHADDVVVEQHRRAHDRAITARSAGRPGDRSQGRPARRRSAWCAGRGRRDR